MAGQEEKVAAPNTSGSHAHATASHATSGIGTTPASKVDRSALSAAGATAMRNAAAGADTWTRGDIVNVQGQLELCNLAFTSSGELDSVTRTALTQALGARWETMSPNEVVNTLKNEYSAAPPLFRPGADAPRSAARTTKADHLPAGFDSALGGANADLRKWVGNKSRGIGFPQMMAPNMDATYFYRLGRIGTHGYGMHKDELTKSRDNLTGMGFPKVEQNELDLVNHTSYAGRRDVLPDARYVAKHYPGGTEMLEATEREPVHFNDPTQIKHWDQGFQRLIGSSAPPSGVMLGHATYDRGGFNLSEADAKMPGYLGNKKFEDVPASMNPVLVKHLRETVGFHGMVVPDWYDMGAIKQFVKTCNLGVDLTLEFKTLVLATLAGVDFLTGVEPDPTTWITQDTRFLTALPALHEEFVRKLDESVQRLWALMPHPGVSLGAVPLTVVDKLMLKSFNVKQATYKPIYEAYIAKRPEVRPVFDVFMKHGIGDFDVWNRTGVMTLIQRQLVVERLSGKKFNALPKDIPDEERWFRDLMANKEFRTHYDAIDWGGAEAAKAFSNALDSYPDLKKSSGPAKPRSRQPNS